MALYMAVEPATVPIILSKDRRLTAAFSVSLMAVPQVLLLMNLKSILSWLHRQTLSWEDSKVPGHAGMTG
jgi:hypothetical protein